MSRPKLKLQGERFILPCGQYVNARWSVGQRNEAGLAVAILVGLGNGAVASFHPTAPDGLTDRLSCRPKSVIMLTIAL